MLVRRAAHGDLVYTVTANPFLFKKKKKKKLDLIDRLVPVCLLHPLVKLVELLHQDPYLPLHYLAFLLLHFYYRLTKD